MTSTPLQNSEDHARIAKILIADDDDVGRKAARLMLEKHGHQVHCVRDGNEVLDLLAREEFDCLLLDIKMENLDGIETTRRIRSSQSGYEHIPIIALTAHALTGDRSRFLRAGLDDYIPKPVDFNELFQVLHRNLPKQDTHNGS